MLSPVRTRGSKVFLERAAQGETMQKSVTFCSMECKQGGNNFNNLTKKETKPWQSNSTRMR